MASKRALWNKAGRFVTGVVVVCFFLPFFGVSCDGMDVITVSGADMVGGCQPGGLLVDAAKQEEAKHPDHPGVKADIGNVPREPLAIAALLVALASFGFAWVRTRGALVASFVLALAGLGTLTALYIKVDRDLHDQISKQAKPGDLAGDKDVSSGGRFGLWAVALGMVATAAVTGLALKERDA